MAVVKKAGIYRVGDAHIQFAEGAEVADDLEMTYVEAFPDAPVDKVAEANAKAAAEPANKAAKAPENK